MALRSIQLVMVFSAVQIAFWLMAPVVTAQELQREDERFVATLELRPMRVDNATAVSDDEEKVSETQLELGAGIDGLWNTELAELATRYNYDKTHYQDDSQANHGQITGASRFSFGNNTTWYQLDASHSIRRILLDPSASATIFENTGEREIVTLTPGVFARLNDANAITLSYSLADIDFDGSSENDSERQGARVIWTRFVSPTREILLSVSEMDIDYDQSDDSDYSIREASLQLYSRQRAFAYSIELGRAVVTQSGFDDRSFTVGGFDVTSRLTDNVFTVFASRSISDSSMGDGNESFFSSDASFDGGIDQRDQIKRTAVGLGWTYENLCSRCAFSINLGLERQEFFTLSENDFDQHFVDLNLAYRIAQDLTFTLISRATEDDFRDAGSPRPDTQALSTWLNLAYEVNHFTEVAMFFERETRSPEGEESITVNQVGLQLSVSYE